MRTYLLLGLDLDGVILDHTEKKLAFAKRYGFTLTRRKTSSDIFNVLVSDEAKETIRHVLCDDPRRAFQAPLLRDAVRDFRELKCRKPFMLISRRNDARMARRALKLADTYDAYVDCQRYRRVASWREFLDTP